jgi:hypothetical protein
MPICDACGEPCDTISVDFGIGAYEFGSERGVHHDYGDASDCCEADVVEGGRRMIRSAVHVARKDHKPHMGRAFIKKGDKYEVFVYFHWRSGGGSWFTQKKAVLERAPIPLETALAPH